MIRPACSLALVALALLLAAGCNSSSNVGPITPGIPPGGSGGNQNPDPPDFGNPPDGQNDPLRVTARLLENDKKAPFTAVLIADIAGGEPPFDVQWDVDQDGLADVYGQNNTATYASNGDFQTTVKVRDNAGAEATSNIEVHVLPPGPDVRILANGQAGLVTGRAPLAVSFNASGTSGVLAKFEWDWEGDGVVDQTSTITGNANHSYTSPGTYTPILTVTDVEGNAEEATVLVIATF